MSDPNDLPNNPNSLSNLSQLENLSQLDSQNQPGSQNVSQVTQPENPSQPSQPSQPNPSAANLPPGSETAEGEQTADDEAESPRIADVRKNALAQSLAAYQGFIDVTKGQLDRITIRTQMILTAASAIATVYGVVLGLRFSLSGSTTHPLPIAGLIPVLFLGVAIVLAVAYLDYVTIPTTAIKEQGSGSLVQQAINDREAFIKWMQQAMGQRLPMLHMSIIGLGFGVVTLPVAFLDASYNWVIWTLLVVGLICTLLPLLRAFVARR